MQEDYFGTRIFYEIKSGIGIVANISGISIVSGIGIVANTSGIGIVASMVLVLWSVGSSCLNCPLYSR